MSAWGDAWGDSWGDAFGAMDDAGPSGESVTGYAGWQSAVVMVCLWLLLIASYGSIESAVLWAQLAVIC